MFDFPVPLDGDAARKNAIECDVAPEIVGGGAEKQESYGGRPLVVLAGDRGEDVAHLLRVVCGREYYDHDDENMPLETIIALLILSTKYDVPSIRSEVIKHLLRHYPTTLFDFDAVDINERNLFGRKRVDCHFDLLRAVLKADVDILLPGLYYICTAISISKIFDKEAHTLDLVTLKVLVVGARKLEAVIRGLLLLIFDGGFTGSRALICPGAAAGTPCKIETKRRSFGMELKFSTTRLVDVKGKDVVQYCLKNGCATCRASLALKVDDVRLILWNKIPAIFGLPSWKTLRLTMKQ